MLIIRNILFSILLPAIFVLLSASCINSRIKSSLVYDLYNTDKPYYLYQVSLFYLTETNVELQTRIPLHEFLNSKNNSETDIKSIFSISYRLYEDSSLKQLLDSATYSFSDSINFRQMYWIDITLPLEIGRNESGFLYVDIKDAQKKNSISFSFHLNKKEKGNRHYFYAETKENSRIPGTRFTSQDTFRIHISPVIQTEKFKVVFFNHFNEVARPPFLNENMKVYSWQPDSIFYIPTDSSVTEYLNFKKPGIYHFMPDSNARSGFTLFITREDYPFITSHISMTGALQYITSNKEFKRILSNPDTQAAIEDFWVSISQNQIKAKKNIRKFYSRVQFANIFFTSYKEGWMTDRGMIYIVIGKPDIVYKTHFSEIWVYGEEQNFNSFKLEFRKVLNPLSDNDFILLRNPSLKEKWNRAADMWRK